MRIALRTGAGRGVYELAGRQGNRVASDLFGLEIFYELTPEIVIPGRSIAEKRQGKPRIALEKPTIARTTHVYRLLSAVLLLPKPKREFKTTHGSELLRFETYSMTAIKVDVAGVTSQGVILRPTDLLLENSDGLQATVDFTKRMARILRLWTAAAKQDSLFANLVRNLSTAIQGKDPDYKEIESRSKEVSDFLETDGDCLALAEQQLKVASDEETATLLSQAAGTEVSEAKFGLEDDVSPEEALVKRVKVWRQQAERGTSGRKFSREVSKAYDYRCMFTGQRLPRMSVTDSPGVDSAHILPWTTYELNSVRNGLCLNKQCHWAFDQGVLRLDFDKASNAYVISLPDHIRNAAFASAFDLHYFASLTGVIPVSRLPQSPSLWPSPTYVNELNEYMSTA